MLIFAVDSEPAMLRDAEQAIRNAEPEAELRCFASAAEALDAIRARGLSPDIVFSAIEMPDISGLEFAVELRTISPDTRIVFVTTYPQYALDAFQVRAHGYVIKPLTTALVRTELEAFPSASRPDRLQVRCFGYFEVFWKGEPLGFARRQTKELFAFLVNRKGASCTTEEVISALWDDDVNMKNAKHRVRNFISDLRETLKGIGMEDVLIRRGQSIAIRPELLDCDYYHMLEANTTENAAFRGEYMKNYSWAEPTAGQLFFRDKSY